MTADRPAVPQPSRPVWQLVTDSGLPYEHFVREAAIALLARDALLGHDSKDAENALVWSRHIMDKHENAEHNGDCVSQCCTCIRCMCDEAKREARELHDD